MIYREWGQKPESVNPEEVVNRSLSFLENPDRIRLIIGKTMGKLDFLRDQADLEANGVGIEFNAIADAGNGELSSYKTEGSNMPSKIAVQVVLRTFRNITKLGETADPNTYIYAFLEINSDNALSPKAKTNLELVKGRYNIRRVDTWEKLDHALQITGPITLPNATRHFTPSQLRDLINAARRNRKEINSIPSVFGIQDKVAELLAFES